MNRISLIFAAVLMFLGPPLFAQQATPYKPGEAAPLTYNGPGRNIPDPAVEEVKFLYFGPADASDSLWNGASLAIQDANREGGYHGKPFRLVPVWDANPWTGGVGKLARAVESEQAWAIIGGTDGSTIHLAAQVTTRLPIVVLNAAATDRSIHNANVPWIFSCVPGDQAISISMAKSIREPFVLLSGTDHDSRSFVSQLTLAMTIEHISPTAHWELAVFSDYKAVAADAISKKATSIVLVAQANEISSMLRALAAAGFKGIVIADPRASRLDEIPANINLSVPVLGNISPDFQSRYSRQYGRAPNYAAAHAYDATMIAIKATQTTGLNRIRIRDAVRKLAPYNGVTGTINWDALGQNDHPVQIGPPSTAP